MKAQLLLDDDITIEDLMEKHKISAAFSHLDGEHGPIPAWTATLVTSKGVNRGSAVGYTLRDAVEGMVRLLPNIIILPEDR